MSKVARFALVGIGTLVVATTLAGVATAFVSGMSRLGLRAGYWCGGAPPLSQIERLQLARTGDVTFGCLFDMGFAVLVAIEAVAWWSTRPPAQVAEWIVPQRTARTFAIELCLAVVVSEKAAFTAWTAFTDQTSDLASLAGADFGDAAASYVRFGVTAATLVVALAAMTLRRRHSWQVAAAATFIAAALDCGALFLQVRFPASIGLVVLPVSLVLIIRTKPYQASRPAEEQLSNRAHS